MSDNQRYYDILNNAFLYFEHAETDAPEQDAVDQLVAAAKADERRRVLDELEAWIDHPNMVTGTWAILQKIREIRQEAGQ